VRDGHVVACSGASVAGDTERVGMWWCVVVRVSLVTQNVLACVMVCSQWCIAKNGGGYMQSGVAKGLKVPCLFMITKVSIRCQKNPRRLLYGVYPPIHHCV